MQTCSAMTSVPCYGKYYVYSSTPALSHADRSRKPKPVQKKPAGSCFPNHATYIRWALQSVFIFGHIIAIVVLSYATRGAHEFYNMMWDPSIYRGNTTKPFYTPEMERCNKKRKELDPSVKRRKFPRKQKQIGGIVRPTISLTDQSEKKGFEDMGLQTEAFLQDLTVDVVKKDMCTQIEAETTRQDEGKCVLRPFMIGSSQTCQTDCNLSFAFDENVRPIQKQLSKKIMEQSLLETTEEMELESLRKEKRKYIEIRREEMYTLKRAVDAQRAVAEDRARAMNLSQEQANMESEAEARLGAALFSASCMGGMLPITFGFLQLEGFMSESGAHDLYENLVPWMNEEVRKSYGKGKTVSRKLLDEMLREVATEREAEFAVNQYWNRQTNLELSESLSPTEDDQLTTSKEMLKARSMMFDYPGEQIGED